jgi:hypothetical protein
MISDNFVQSINSQQPFLCLAIPHPFLWWDFTFCCNNTHPERGGGMGDYGDSNSGPRRTIPLGYVNIRLHLPRYVAYHTASASCITECWLFYVTKTATKKRTTFYMKYEKLVCQKCGTLPTSLPPLVGHTLPHSWHTSFIVPPLAQSLTYFPLELISLHTHIIIRQLGGI